MSKNRSNDWLAFLAGIAVGSAIGFYLNSDQGRTMRADAAHRLTEAEQKARQTISEQASNLSTKVTGAIDTVKEKANSVVETAQSRFNKGMEKAKREIEASETEQSFDKETV